MTNINIFPKTEIVCNGTTPYTLVSVDEDSLKSVIIKSKVQGEEININLLDINFEEVEFEEDSFIGETTLEWIRNSEQNFKTVDLRPIECSDDLKDEYREELEYLISIGYSIELPITEFKGLKFSVSPSTTSSFETTPISLGSGARDFYYSYDGEEWNPWEVGKSVYISDSKDGARSNIYVKGSGVSNSSSSPIFRTTTIGYLTMNISGNITSLIDGTGDSDSIPAGNNFKYMFAKSEKITNAKDLVLPKNINSESAFANMFYQCNRLQTAPSILPALELTNYCYQGMFQNCSALVSAPEISATKLGAFCCHNMFFGCLSLTTVPGILPAVELTNYCYAGMFANCTKLTKCPQLPATVVSDHCYSSMFSGCASLEEVPYLPATQLNSKSYAYMFQNCRKINYIKVGARTWNLYAAEEWLQNVASSGTFVIDNNILEVGTETGQIPFPSNSGIPEGWAIEGGKQPGPEPEPEEGDLTLDSEYYKGPVGESSEDRNLPLFEVSAGDTHTLDSSVTKAVIGLNKQQPDNGDVVIINNATDNDNILYNDYLFNVSYSKGKTLTATYSSRFGWNTDVQ